MKPWLYITFLRCSSEETETSKFVMETEFPIGPWCIIWGKRSMDSSGRLFLLQQEIIEFQETKFLSGMSVNKLTSSLATQICRTYLRESYLQTHHYWCHSRWCIHGFHSQNLHIVDHHLTIYWILIHGFNLKLYSTKLNPIKTIPVSSQSQLQSHHRLQNPFISCIISSISKT